MFVGSVGYGGLADSPNFADWLIFIFGDVFNWIDSTVMNIASLLAVMQILYFQYRLAHLFFDSHHQILPVLN